MIAEIASELLRIEGTSIAISVAVTERGTEVSVRADSRLLGDDQERIVRVVDYLLEHAFPGVSGFKYERRPPHRVEGGACVPAHEGAAHAMAPRQRRRARRNGTVPSWPTAGSSRASWWRPARPGDAASRPEASAEGRWR